jgi:hypothetical protein
LDSEDPPLQARAAGLVRGVRATDWEVTPSALLQGDAAVGRGDFQFLIIRRSFLAVYAKSKEDSMLKRALLFVFLAGLVAAVLSASNDPFVGEWKLNASKSKLIDEMKVESAGGNKYAFDFGGGKPETIAADGTDQPGLGGTTLSVTVEGPDAWKVVRKKDGRMLLTGNWTLSKDGKTLTDDYTEIGPNGNSSNVIYVYKRTAGSAGFAGTWESTSQTINFELVLKVQPYEGEGLSIVSPSEEETTNVKFDGKDYPKAGPNVRKGSTSSARRVNPQTVEITDKVNGKTAATRQIELSSDLKTLTMTVHRAGRREPNILVFERQ